MQIALVGAAEGLGLLAVGTVLLALLGALMWSTRRLMGRRLRQGARTIPLTAQHAVFVVEVEGRRLLLGVGPTGAPRLLCELGPEASGGPSVVEAVSRHGS